MEGETFILEYDIYSKIVLNCAHLETHAEWKSAKADLSQACGKELQTVRCRVAAS